MDASKRRMMMTGVAAGLAGSAFITLWFVAVGAAQGGLYDLGRQLAVGTGPMLAFLAFPKAPAGLVLAYVAFQFALFALLGACGAWALTYGRRDTLALAPLSLATLAAMVFFIALLFGAGPAQTVAFPAWKLMLGDFMAVAIMAIVFLSGEARFAGDITQAWRGVLGMEMGVICPRTGGHATIRVDLSRHLIQACSNWPKDYECRRECARETYTGDAPIGASGAATRSGA
jgi:hypothetical protein